MNHNAWLFFTIVFARCVVHHSRLGQVTFKRTACISLGSCFVLVLALVQPAPAAEGVAEPVKVAPEMQTIPGWCQTQGEKTSARVFTSGRASHWSDITTLGFHPDGSLLATGSDQSIRLWHTDNMQPAGAIDYFPLDLRQLCFSSDGRIFVVLHEPRDEDLYMYTSSMVIVFEQVGGEWQEQARLTGFWRHIQSMVVSPDASRLFVDDGKQAIHVYDISQRHPRWIQVILFPSELLSGSPMKPYNMPRDSRAGPRVSGIARPPMMAGFRSHRSAERPLALAVSRDGSLLVVATDKKLRSYRSKDHRWEEISNNDTSGTALALTPDSRFLVVAKRTGPLEVWDVEQGVITGPPRLFDFEINDLTSMDLSVDGTRLAIGQSQGNPAFLVRVNDGAIEGPRTLVDDDSPASQISFGDTANRLQYVVQSIQWDGFRSSPVAFHPTVDRLASAQRNVRLYDFDGHVDSTLATQVGGDNIQLWDASSRRIQWLDDNQSVFVSTPDGGVRLDTETGEIQSELSSVGMPQLSRNGDYELTYTLNQNSVVRVAIHQRSSGKQFTKRFGPWGSLASAQIRFDRDNSQLAWIDHRSNQLRILDLARQAISSKPLLQPSQHVIGFDDAQHPLVAQVTESDVGGQLYRVVAYDSEPDADSEPQVVHEVGVHDAGDCRFIVSANQQVIVFQEGNGRFQVVSQPTTRRSAKPIHAIQCVSGDGEFLVTLDGTDATRNTVSTVHTRSRVTLQQWRFPGRITSLDLSPDDQNIATTNSDGSISVLRLIRREDWPESATIVPSNPTSATIPPELQAEYDAIVAQGDEEIDAFKSRMAAATDDNRIETECSEPYSAYVVRLLNFASEHPETEVEFLALHRAISMPRVVPPHVPGAAWSKKRDQWYKVSAQANRLLKTAARLQFADRYVDDPRIASVLREVIEFWSSRQNADVIKYTGEIFQRTVNRKVKAAALLLSAEANMTEQVTFLSSGHRITPPTTDQLNTAAQILEKVKQEFSDIDIDGIGNVATKAYEMLEQLNSAQPQTTQEEQN